MATQKLLPPSIESKLPAQFGDTLRIPFLHNRSVGSGDYSGMVLKIKTISTNKDIGTYYAEGNFSGVNIITFNIDKNALTVGQHYKAQLAYYRDENIVDYYSTVGIFKYTQKPVITIVSNKKENTISSIIYGCYSNEEDPTEKVYSYHFNIYENEELFVTSGELLHNSVDDNFASSTDTYNFDYKLDILSTYTIEYVVTTSNGLIASSPLYYIDKGVEIPSPYNYKVVATVDNENGGINIQLKMEGNIQGKFRLVRSSSEIQEIIREFIINDIANGYYDLGTDYTVQQGITYKYGVQQYNDSFTTDLIESNEVLADFEDAFLFDGERQLKIKFNPKISSFKDTILESKLDTIGSRYPFVFRNGRTKYKEFPISGLISYWMDNENLFTVDKNNFSTNLTGDIIAAERQFKLEVLEWLNNGQPKLFRSPTEGNYIIRLMNVSLSPNDTLGRMLHTFNCTAYEIAEYNYTNLKEKGFIGQQQDFGNLWHFYTHDFTEQDEEFQMVFPALWARIYGDIGAKYTLYFADGTSFIIYIGATGSYEFSAINNLLTKVVLSTKTETPAKLPYKIEYATTQIDTINIPYQGNTVSQIELLEFAKYFSTSEETEIINNLLAVPEENARYKYELDNILILQIENLGDEGYAKFKMSESDEEITINFNNTVITHPSNKFDFIKPWKQDIRGRLLLTAADFNGKFILKSLTLSSNMRADIYYKIKKISW